MRVAILQSNYLPWRGYFSLIDSVDLFVFHDDLQYTKGDWRNRNLFVDTNQNPTWLTIPVGNSEKRLICEVQLPLNNWETKHHQRIIEWYSGARNFQVYEPLIREIYLNNRFATLSDYNQFWTKQIAKEIFGSTTEFIDSRSLNLTQTKSRRVLEIIRKVGGEKYLTGPSARNYLIETDFWEQNIEIEYADYNNLPMLVEDRVTSGECSIMHDLLIQPNPSSLLGEL